MEKFLKRLSIELLALLVFCLGVICRFYDSFPELGSNFLGGADQDGGLYIWLVRSFTWNWRQAVELQSSAFYPYGLSRAWSDNFLLPSSIFYLFRICGIGEPLSYNLLLLGAAALNGYSVYVACRSFDLPFYPSLASGFLFQGVSYFWTNLGHPQLQFAFFIPLTLAFTIRAIRSNYNFWWLCIGITIAAAFLTTVYYAIFCYIVAGTAFVASLVFEPKNLTVKRIATTGFLVVLGTTPILPFLSAYREVRSTFDIRHLYEAYYFSASSLSYLSYSPLNRFFAWTSNWNSAEGQLGGSLVQLGIVAICSLVLAYRAHYRKLLSSIAIFFIATCILSCNPIEGVTDRYLAAVGTWIVIVLVALFFLRSRRAAWIENGSIAWPVLVAIAVVFFFLSLGPLGNPAKGESAFSFYVPFYVAAPGVDSLRAVARYGLVVWICVAISVPMLLNRVLGKTFQANMLLTAVVLASTVEGFPTAFPLEEMPDRPEVLSNLSSVATEDTAVLFVPLADEVTRDGVRSWGEFARFNTRYMNWSLGIPGRIVNGYSGQRSKLTLELPVALKDFPSDQSLKRLSTIAGLRFIVVVPDLWKTRSAQEIESKIGEFPERLSVIAKDKNGNLLLEFSPHFAPGYFIAPPQSEIHIEWKEKPSESCLPRWAHALTSNAADIQQSLIKSSKRLPSQGIIAAVTADSRIRPRIAAFDAECAPPAKSTSVRESAP